MKQRVIRAQEQRNGAVSLTVSMGQEYAALIDLHLDDRVLWDVAGKGLILKKAEKSRLKVRQSDGDALLVSLPKEYAAVVGFMPGDSVVWSSAGNGLLLQKVEPSALEAMAGFVHMSVDSSAKLTA